MIELPLSTLAWLGVVAVQAFVHFIVLKSRQRQTKFPLLLEDEAESLKMEDSGNASLISYSYHNVSSCPDLSNVGIDEGRDHSFSEDELDGNEPENFLELLEQTGEEIVQFRSIENIAKEQIVSTTMQ